MDSTGSKAAPDLNEAAKRVLIAYRQLSKIVKSVGVASALANIVSYNRILDTLNQCFSINPAFSDAVSHLHPLDETGGSAQLAAQVKADAAILLATSHAFIELYLSPEDKKKAIGFQA